MRPSEALARHRDEVRAIIARYPVSNPRVFGSVARGEDVDGSDLDILVDGRHGETTFVHLDGLQSDISELLGVPVDIMTPGGFSEPVAARVRRDVRPL
ncbi:nucleotidyltransferase [Mesorhizobium ephedrae]|uniref:Nucleotidyltransferase n=2 Tax=Kumtagia ephedrae TaxID=2116701 RepID=A0A2P7STU2_9HYPH|nr:nucleotidyltransferase family protein [Mesorhizobium ephedrae]PSJ65867.1 nucleotidyltransferase [Mesorhizobium ephedrae]